MDGLGAGADDGRGGGVDGVIVEEGTLGLVLVALGDQPDEIVPSVGIVWDAQ